MSQQKNQKFVKKNLSKDSSKPISDDDNSSNPNIQKDLDLEDLKKEIESLRNQISELNEKLSTSEAQRDDYFGKFQRLGADFENFKKRSNEEKILLSKMAVEPFVKAFFPIFDAFNIATKDLPSELKKNSWVLGVVGIREKILFMFSSLGVSLIDPVKNSDFDPNFCESLSVEKVEGVEQNKILEVYQVGFKLGEKILRPARVKVSG